METDSQEIVNSFVDQYGLTRGQVIAEIEKTFSSMLSRWHRKNVIAMFTEGHLQALAYEQDAGGRIIQTPVDLARMRGWNTIRRIIEQNLGKAACLDEVARLKRLEHQVFWGEIVRKNGRALQVEIPIEPGQVIMATCLLQHIGRHERDSLLAGQCRAFHLRRVDPVSLNGTPRTRVLVDRVSKHLVSGLLQSRLDGVKVTCRKRYVGRKSFVGTDRFIPRRIILETARELGEHIQVKVQR
ncbi:hypothetical protein ACLG6S_16375 [Thermodesulfobacteriota bacterium B35]